MFGVWGGDTDGMHKRAFMANMNQEMENVKVIDQGRDITDVIRKKWEGTAMTCGFY